MSSTVTVYAVSVDRLKQVVGSGDQALIDAIVEGQADFLASIDEIDDEAERTCAEAVADLVNGETSDDAPGYLYGYALETICRHVGQELPNISGISRASQWIEKIDAVLTSKGVPLRFSNLVYDGTPIPIPEPDDSPSIGQWPAGKIPAALAAIQSIEPAGIDNDMDETFAQMRGWFERAAKTPGVSIVGFLS
jgi:hypothetical protein